MERKIPEKLKYNKKDVYEELIKWLEENNGKFPRSIIRKNGKILKREEMTEEERKEVCLCWNWNNYKKKKFIEECVERPVEEVPEEYREEIQKLKSLQQARKNKDIEIKNRMKKAVGKHVKDNEKTRQEIEDMEPKTGKTKNNGFEPSDD